MNAATLYMIVVCAGRSGLCFPLQPYGFTMTKPECKAALEKVYTQYSIAHAQCFGISEWTFAIKEAVVPPLRPLILVH